jgi:hypothetical protein
MKGALTLKKKAIACLLLCLVSLAGCSSEPEAIACDLRQFDTVDEYMRWEAQNSSEEYCSYRIIPTVRYEGLQLSFISTGDHMSAATYVYTLCGDRDAKYNDPTIEISARREIGNFDVVLEQYDKKADGRTFVQLREDKWAWNVDGVCVTLYMRNFQSKDQMKELLECVTFEKREIDISLTQ